MSLDTPARIAVLGSGPIGLEAALYARYLGYDVDIYERARVADHVLSWGHVRMFTPFGLNRSPLALAALKAQDAAWEPPADDALLTGREYCERFLLPLAQSDLLADSLHERTEVVAIGRDGLLKGELAGDEARGDHDFRLLLASTNADDHGRQRIATADAVIDATGTYGQHNWLGDGGIPAVGEQAAAAHFEYGLPDLLGAAGGHYASRNILLVGDGHSAATNLAALADLAAHAADTWITWVTRRECDEKAPCPIEPIPDDAFPERQRVTRLANRLAADDANHVTFFSGTTVDALTWHADLERFSVRLVGKHAGELEFDRVIANVGFRGDESIYRELHVAEIDPAAGPVQREPDFYILGDKSRGIFGTKIRGRDSRFLISDGLEQIRAVFAIIGDRPDLNLYATMAGLA